MHAYCVENFRFSVYDYIQYMQYISRVNGEEIHVDKVIRITTPKAEEWIQKFDEHTVDMCHKFGIIYQKEGQVMSVCVCMLKISY